MAPKLIESRFIVSPFEISIGRQGVGRSIDISGVSDVTTFESFFPLDLPKDAAGPDAARMVREALWARIAHLARRTTSRWMPKDEFIGELQAAIDSSFEVESALRDRLTQQLISWLVRNPVVAPWGTVELHDDRVELRARVANSTGRERARRRPLPVE